MCILCVHVETSSLWAEFVNKNRCISVRLVSDEIKALNFDNFDNSHNSLLWPEYFIDFLFERWIPCQASKSVLCLHYHPETVHCSTKDVYTSKITFFALHPWMLPSFNFYWFRIDNKHMTEPWLDQVLMDSAYRNEMKFSFCFTCHTLKLYNPYIFETWWFKIWIFQT